MKKSIFKTITNRIAPIRFTIIDRYLIREFLKNTIGALALFIILYLFSLLVGELKYYLNEDNPLITKEYVAKMYMYKIPYMMVLLSPIAFLFGTVYTLGQFYKNNEVVAVIGSGVYLFRFSASILIISLVFSISLIYFSDYVVAPTWDKAEEMSDVIRNKITSETALHDVAVGGADNIFYFIKYYNIAEMKMDKVVINKERFAVETDDQERPEFIDDPELEEMYNQLVTGVEGGDEEGDQLPPDSLDIITLPRPIVNPVSLFQFNNQIQDPNLVERSTTLEEETEYYGDQRIVMGEIAPGSTQQSTASQLDQAQGSSSQGSITAQPQRNQVQITQFPNARNIDDEPAETRPAGVSQLPPNPNQDLTVANVSRNVHADNLHRFQTEIRPGSSRNLPQMEADTNQHTNIAPQETSPARRLAEPINTYPRRTEQEIRHIIDTNRQQLALADTQNQSNTNRTQSQSQSNQNDLNVINQVRNQRTDLYVRSTQDNTSTRTETNPPAQQTSTQPRPSNTQQIATDVPDYIVPVMSRVDQNRLSESPQFNPVASNNPLSRDRQNQQTQSAASDNIRQPVNISQINESIHSFLDELHYSFPPHESAVAQSNEPDEQRDEGTDPNQSDNERNEQANDQNNNQINEQDNNRQQFDVNNLSGVLTAQQLNLLRQRGINPMDNSMDDEYMEVADEQTAEDLAQLLDEENEDEYGTFVPPFEQEQQQSDMAETNQQPAEETIVQERPRTDASPLVNIVDLSQYTVNRDLFFDQRVDPFIEWRIDAREIKWDNDEKVWIAMDAVRREWDWRGNLINIEYLDNEPLVELDERPYHFVDTNKKIERLTLQEAKLEIYKLARGHKRFRKLEVEMYSRKIAFQFATFVVVLVGLTLGRFHSRKAVFIQSFIMALVVFFLYFVIYQFGESLGKKTDIPAYIAPHLGNVIYIVLGAYLMRKSQT